MERGLYCLSGFPEPPDFDLVELSLLSADRAGVLQLGFSHETALRLHELSEVNPVQLAATVPPGFRKHLRAGVHLTHAVLTERDWEKRAGYSVTTPLRTLRMWPLVPGVGRISMMRCSKRSSVGWCAGANWSRR